MYNQPVTHQERTLVAILRWWAFLFAAAGIAFAIFPEQIVTLINTLGHSIMTWNAPPIDVEPNPFWLVLSITMMLMLFFCAVKAQMDIVNNSSFVKLIIISKFASTVGYVICFVLLHYSFAYLVGAAVDGSIFLITLIVYRRAYLSRNIK